MSKVVNVYFDRVIYRLLCMYAFFIPLEKILEVLWDIDTIFKPYRVVALLIIGVFALKSLDRWDENRDIKTDVFLYVIFIYGLIITSYRMITTRFNMGYFANDAFQITLYLVIFIVIKNSRLSQKQVLSILKFLLIGTMVNVLYILYSFLILKSFSNRDAGFMDNPNYLALSLVLLLLYLFANRKQITTNYQRAILLLVLPIVCYIFIITGSRSGLLVLALIAIVVLYFLDFREKIIIGLLGTGMFLFVNFLSGQSYESVGRLALLQRIGKDTKSDPRIPVWRGAYRASLATNFTGTGIGQFKARFREFHYQENHDLIRRMLQLGYFLSAHSDYFALLAIYGVIGLLCYLTFIILTLKNILVKIYESYQSDEKLYYQFGFLVLLSLVLFGITAENFSSPLYWILLSTSAKVNFQ